MENVGLGSLVTPKRVCVGWSEAIRTVAVVGITRKQVHGDRFRTEVTCM